MDYQRQIIMIVVVSILLVISSVDSYRADFMPSPSTGALLGSSSMTPMIQQQQQQQNQQGCVWSTVNNNNNNNKNASVYPPFLQRSNRANSYSLDCHVRTLNNDFWSNYTFNRDQLESTSSLSVKCNDKLFFESILHPNQSFFRLRNLAEISLHSCKVRKIPTRIWASLGMLKSLTISSFNGEWSSAVGMDVESAAFEGLSNLEKLDLSLNNIWAIQDRNVFCPLKNLAKFNVSWNRLTDVDELGFSSSNSASFREESGGGVSNSPCVLNIQNLDLSYNQFRSLNHNSFGRLRKLSELRLQNNFIEELEDSAFYGLNGLRLLNLSSNRLVALPPTIFNSNPTLREINLSNNSISALSPQVFSGLNQLFLLDLSRNSITSLFLRDSIFSNLRQLIVLKISFNKLSYLDQNVFKDLTNLQSLHVDNNRIESISPVAFHSLQNLKSLDLQNNRLSLIDSRHFANLVVLRQLYLDHNKINEMDKDSLKNCTKLQDLGLADNLLTEVPMALRNLALVTLDIGENRIEKISNSSFYGLGQLYGLRLVDNRLTEIGSGFCDHLTKLRVLNVAQNRISKISGNLACPELRALRLDSNRLEGIVPNLGQQLPNLLWLNISENHIRHYTLEPSSLEWLDVSHNQLEYLGGVSDGVYSLRVIDASFNKLSTLDYTTIPPSLETLRLNQNKIQNIAHDTFIRLTNLRRVELIHNEIERLDLASIKFSPVPTSKTLPEFFLGGNPFLCDSSMEWLTRVSQLSILRQYPRIVDFDTLVCRPTFIRPSSSSPPSTQLKIVDANSKDFLSKYVSQCFHLCHCCDYSACDCKNECSEGCECYHDASWSVNVIQCSSLNATSIPSIPMDATEVYLDGNLISLKSHAFLGRKNLRSLFLNNSNIESIQNKSFNGLKALEVLHLENNLLRELQGFEFANLETLRELYLQNNLLHFIAKDTFASLTFLQVLRLDGNLLIDFQVWELGNGYLNSVMLSNNPWECNCEFLIPFRAWVANAGIAIDFSNAKCTTTNNNDDKVIDMQHQQQQQHLISNMCDHNKELNFNFNKDNIPHIMDSNHISAEKVAANNNDMDIIMPNSNNHNHPYSSNYPSINEISTAEAEEAAVDQESGEMWTIFTIIIIIVIIILLIVAFLVFRNGHSNSNSLFPLWLYSFGGFSCCCGGNDEESSSECKSCNHGFLSSLFYCCCGGGGSSGHAHGKKSRSTGTFGGVDDADKLFDAYFLYSRQDENIVVEKIAPELESSPLISAYSAAAGIPPPPQTTPNYRLCLHYRDLCLSAENNIDMVLSACDASKRIVLVISETFLKHDLTHPDIRFAVQTMMAKYQKKLIFIQLGSGVEVSSHLFHSSSSQVNSIEWSDTKFFSKLKLLLPTPTLLTTTSSSPSGLNSTSTISSSNSSAIFNMAQHPYHHHHQHHQNLINYNNALSLHEYAYNTINSQHYHRNILPFQQLNGNTPPVPKHHIALSAPGQYLQQNQNFYNNSQHSQIIPIPGYPATTATTTLAGHPQGVMVPNSFHQPQPPNNISFNESFRRHLQLQQSQNKGMMMMNHQNHHQHHPSNCSSQSQGHLHHHNHQGSHSSSTSNNNPSSIHPYQPLGANYSSSGSNEELLDHVYSTLDSPPIINTNINITNGENANSKQLNNNESNENSSAPPQLNRLNNNNVSSNPAGNSNNNNSNDNASPPTSAPNNNNTNNPGGTMYFV